VGGAGGAGGGGGGTTWSARRQLTLDAGDNVNIQNFPVLVVLTSADIDYGATLRFTDNNDVRLPHEIERWDESGQSFVWVRVPQISQTGANKASIRMYYGNAMAPDGQLAADVWKPAFRGVWHLSQADDALTDSSGTNGTAKNFGSTQTGGPVANGRAFDRTQLQYIDTNFKDDLQQFTVEAWVRATAMPSTALGPNGPFMRQEQFQMVWDHPTPAFRAGISFKSGANWNGVSFVNLAANQWLYLAATYDGTTLRSYVNGVLGESKAVGAPNTEANTAKIGRHPIDTEQKNHFDGLIDEVRVSNVARDAQWIAAQHRSMRNVSGEKFVSFGAEEQGTYSLP
jgi:biopolymer transport protein ExbB